MTEAMTAPEVTSRRRRPWVMPDESNRVWDLVRLPTGITAGLAMSAYPAVAGLF